jgi:branched-chain amino acid aminotransferase
VTELRIGLVSGHVREAFGAGTAAVVSPISTIGIDGVDYDLPAGSVALTLRDALDAIRLGRNPDPYGWNYFV